MAIIGSAIVAALSSAATFVESNAAWLIPTVGLLGAAGAGTASAITAHQQQRQQAQQAADNARMQQQQMEYNKRMEEREAAALEAETAENVRRQRLESERLRSAQIALLGKSGAAMASGSPLAVLGATALMKNEKRRICTMPEPEVPQHTVLRQSVMASGLRSPGRISRLPKLQSRVRGGWREIWRELRLIRLVMPAIMLRPAKLSVRLPGKLLRLWTVPQPGCAHK